MVVVSEHSCAKAVICDTTLFRNAAKLFSAFYVIVSLLFGLGRGGDKKKKKGRKKLQLTLSASFVEGKCKRKEIGK